MGISPRAYLLDMFVAAVLGVATGLALGLHL